MHAISRPCSIANLDPANDNIPYNAAFDVRELVSVEEVMEREQLGPNGGVLWAMEEVEANFDWLEEKLEACGMCLRASRTSYSTDESLKRRRLCWIRQANRSLLPITAHFRRYCSDWTNSAIV